MGAGKGKEFGPWNQPVCPILAAISTALCAPCEFGRASVRLMQVVLLLAAKHALTVQIIDGGGCPGVAA
jgi:hypothetical protein